MVFDHAVPEDKKDSDLKEKLMTERDGILMWALEGLKRLMENKWKFSETDRTRQALSNYKSKNSSALAFIQEECVVAPEAECFRQDLYNVYEEYCHANGYKEALSLQKFNSELDGVKGVTRGQENSGASNRKTWIGIRLV